MKEIIYRKLQQKIITLTLLVAFTPLLILGITMYHQFANTSREKTDEQIRYRARSQAEAVDRFFKERTAILGSMVDTHSFKEMTDEGNLSRIFEIMNSRCGAFVDLGVIDQNGQHLAYVGPYDLKGKNYFDQPWFAEVVSTGVYKSDVFMGYRKQPHFIIAVRRYEMRNPWILRATIDPDILGEIVRSAHIGKTGDTYIINRQGVYQTKPRFKGKLLSTIDLDTNLFGGQVEVVEKRSEEGRAMLYAGSWLKDDKWLLMVQQEPSELMSGLLAVRFAEIAIIVCGLIAIIVTTIFTTRLAIGHLKRSDDKMAELNAELVQSDKLASLGKMAAGVAHEINNPLAVILQKTGWMEDLLLEEEFRKSENIDEFQMSIQKIEEHVDRARKVVHNMLGYARKMEPRLEDVDINETLNQTIDMLENYSRNNNIEIQTNFVEHVPIIASDQAQLQQVFLNLVTNAIDAIGKDGLIEIKGSCDDSDIYITITDDGPGISEEMQKRVFDPFFTTKETGKGTGLGLWVTFNIIEKMGGTIRVKSKDPKTAAKKKDRCQGCFKR
ncbi:MAG: sensor histidine kinase [Deltaproteobacteria bacterium]|nr:sensor histidine kinase [Deltaproteobacteria bacterium]